jgi:hypothetical protein
MFYSINGYKVYLKICGKNNYLITALTAPGSLDHKQEIQIYKRVFCVNHHNKNQCNCTILMMLLVGTSGLTLVFNHADHSHISSFPLT